MPRDKQRQQPLESPSHFSCSSRQRQSVETATETVSGANTLLIRQLRQATLLALRDLRNGGAVLSAEYDTSLALPCLSVQNIVSTKIGHDCTLRPPADGASHQ